MSGNLSEKSPAQLPPDPPGEYVWAGKRVKFNYARIAARLGKVPDTELALEISADRQRVFQLRRKLGIMSNDGRCRERIRPLLGKMLDTEIARRVGVSYQVVQRMRKKLGIPRADVKKCNEQKQLQAYLNTLEKEPK